MFYVYSAYHQIKFDCPPPVTPTDAELGITADEGSAMIDDSKATGSSAAPSGGGAGASTPSSGQAVSNAGGGGGGGGSAAAAVDMKSAPANTKTPGPPGPKPTAVAVNGSEKAGGEAVASPIAAPPQVAGNTTPGSDDKPSASYDYGSHSDVERNGSGSDGKSPASPATGGGGGAAAAAASDSPDTNSAGPVWKRQKIHTRPVSPEQYAAAHHKVKKCVSFGSGGRETGPVQVTGLTQAQHDNELIDKILGVLYGNALGDAFGLSTEFMDREDISQCYPTGTTIPFPDFKRNHHNSRWESGDWTDDTDQMILICETIIETRKADILLFAKKLKHWISNGFPQLGDCTSMSYRHLNIHSC